MPLSTPEWPGAHRSAAAFTFDVDAESGAIAFDHTFVDRMSLMTHQQYGPTVAVPKLLAMLRRQDVKATFFVPGYTAELHPDIVKAFIDEGHEIGHHGYLHENTRGMSEADEAAMIDRGLDALDAVAGVRPVGYRAPWWEYNWHTTKLLAERGFRYDSSLLDGDAPYLYAGEGMTDEQALIEVPIDWALDDWEQYAFYPGWTGSGVIESPNKALELWSLEAEASNAAGGCFVLTNHPFITGRPSRLTALETLIERVKSLDGVWITTLEQIAEHARTVVTDVHRHQRLPDPGPLPGQPGSTTGAVAPAAQELPTTDNDPRFASTMTGEK